MFSFKKSIFIISSTFFISLIGCSHSQPASVHQSAKAYSPTAPQKYDLSSLHIQMPPNWQLDSTDTMYYRFTDDTRQIRGGISSMEYEEDFKFQHIKPNHSSIINDEYIDISLGTCNLVTLDADNGTAASGITGTHNVYYAVITAGENVIYVLDFSKYDKSTQAKQQFMELLKGIQFKESTEPRG